MQIINPVKLCCEALVQHDMVYCIHIICIYLCVCQSRIVGKLVSIPKHTKTFIVTWFAFIVWLENYNGQPMLEYEDWNLELMQWMAWSFFVHCSECAVLHVSVEERMCRSTMHLPHCKGKRWLLNSEGLCMPWTAYLIGFISLINPLKHVTWNWLLRNSPLPQSNLLPKCSVAITGVGKSGHCSHRAPLGLRERKQNTGRNMWAP